MIVSRSVLKRLTYANVMATLAFVIASGSGGAYAVTQINGHDIKGHTIPVSKLVKGAVVPRAVSAENVSHLLITHAKRKHAAHGKLARLANASGTSIPMVSMSLGQTVTVFQSGPFTVTASCIDDGGGKYDVDIDGTGTVAWRDNGAGTIPAGHTEMITQTGGYGHPQVLDEDPSDGMFADDGESLTFSTTVFALHVYGDCAFMGSAVAG
jgi:hypothetical protein